MLKIHDKQQTKPRMSHYHKSIETSCQFEKKMELIKHKLLINNIYSKDLPRASAWQNKNVLQLYEHGAAWFAHLCVMSYIFA